MKKQKYFAIILVILTMAVQSCDKIEEPFIKEGKIVWNGRKIIIYDFTGHKCGNCPRAHETIDNLIDIYGDAIVPVAIHCTSFARVTNPDTTAQYHYDFRTDIGDFLGGRDSELGFYGELTLPVGLVNNLSSDVLSPHTAWGTEIAKIISSFPEYLITINPAFSSVDSLISADIEITTNINNNRKLSLVVLIVEDNIIEWQKDYSLADDDIENYEHNHVLRGDFNGNFGEIIKDNTNQTVNGDVLQKSYSLKSGSDWKTENCSIVAFVYDYETKEILQAEVTHLVE
ncbi:MAG TPA: Omp28-related outer membrane protein [Bacteroidales bacterium]|mgnify:CR=1 FL=1|nr:Omp28-related outer membrane protein [Bacteroidales bacterium]